MNPEQPQEPEETTSEATNDSLEVDISEVPAEMLEELYDDLQKPDGSDGFESLN